MVIDKIRLAVSLLILFSLTAFSQQFSEYDPTETFMTVEGFPEGCSYANIREPLDYHDIKVGIIEWTLNGWYFSYVDQHGLEHLRRIPVAENVGLMGQDPYEDLSAALRSRTPNGFFVVAQIHDRDYMGLSPIVTCISQAFNVVERDGRYDYGQDYWIAYRLAKRARFERSKYRRWLRWKRDRTRIRSHKRWRKIRERRLRRRKLRERRRRIKERRERRRRLEERRDRRRRLEERRDRRRSLGERRERRRSLEERRERREERKERVSRRIDREKEQLLRRRERAQERRLQDRLKREKELRERNSRKRLREQEDDANGQEDKRPRRRARQLSSNDNGEETSVRRGRGRGRSGENRKKRLEKMCKGTDLSRGQQKQCERAGLVD